MLQQIGSALLAGFLIVLQFVTGVLGYLDGVPGSGSRPVAPAGEYNASTERDAPGGDL